MYSAAITVAVVLGGALVFGTHYRAMLEAETTATRLGHLEGLILRLDEVLSMSARMAAATGDPQWEARYHRYDRQFDDAIAEAAAIEPDVGKPLERAISVADEALDDREHRAFELDREGRRAEAAALFDAAYEQFKQTRARGMQDLMSGVGGAVSRRLEAQESSLIAVVCASAAALVFLVLLWIHMLRLIRRYIHDRSRAEAELRAAHATLEARIEAELRQAQKLESVGRLAAASRTRSTRRSSSSATAAVPPRRDGELDRR